MNCLVVYDSNYGNTKIIADTVAKGLGNETRSILVSNFKTEDLQGIDILVVGSPINGWKPTENIGSFLDSLGPQELSGIKTAAFDTRITLFIHGDAAKKIARQLEAAGATMAVPPQAFIVRGTEGPLADGEIDKATNWAADILKAAQATH